MRVSPSSITLISAFKFFTRLIFVINSVNRIKYPIFNINWLRIVFWNVCLIMPHWSWKAPLWEMGVKSRDTSNQLYAREWCSSGPRKKKHHLIFMKQALSGRNQYKWQKGLNISLFITFWSLIISNVIIVWKLQKSKFTCSIHQFKLNK